MAVHEQQQFGSSCSIQPNISQQEVPDLTYIKNKHALPVTSYIKGSFDVSVDGGSGGAEDVRGHEWV